MIEWISLWLQNVSVVAAGVFLGAWAWDTAITWQENKKRVAKDSVIDWTSAADAPTEEDE